MADVGPASERCPFEYHLYLIHMQASPARKQTFDCASRATPASFLETSTPKRLNAITRSLDVRVEISC